jgi:hypothetical protein
MTEPCLQSHFLTTLCFLTATDLIPMYSENWTDNCYMNMEPKSTFN